MSKKNYTGPQIEFYKIVPYAVINTSSSEEQIRRGETDEQW